MKFYDIQIYSKNIKFLAIAQLLTKDKTHNFMCDSLSVDDDVMYITSYNCDITVKHCDDIYIISVYDYTNGEKNSLILAVLSMLQELFITCLFSMIFINIHTCMNIYYRGSIK